MGSTVWPFVLVLLASLFHNMQCRPQIVKVVALTKKTGRPVTHGLKECDQSINMELNKEGKIKIDIDLIAIDGDLFSKKIIERKEFSEAMFILELYSVDSFSCVLGELFGIPVISVFDAHNPVCKNVISMRPDTAQLHNATLELIKKFHARVVAVIIQDSIGESAIKFMSQGKLTQRFPFQVVGKVNFDDENSNSLRNAIRKLKDSKIKRVLLMVHNRNVETIKLEAFKQGLPLDDYKWFVPYMDANPNDILRTYAGVAGLKIGYPKRKLVDDCKNPLIYDALNLIANASIEFLSIKHSLARKSGLCPSKDSQQDGRNLRQLAKMTEFEGRTGTVKFLKKSGYRNVSQLEAWQIVRRELQNGKEEIKNTQLGIWSATCKKMIWDRKAKNDKHLIGCKERKKDSKDPLDGFMPEKMHLYVVTVEGAPFIEFDKTKKGNDGFKGFCKDLLDRLAQDLNFTYTMYIGTEGSYSPTVKNGSSNGMIRDLLIKKADIAIGSLTITSEREQHIDFTKPFMDFTMSLILRKPPQEKVDIFAFLLPFRTELWISVGAMIVVTAMILFVLDRYSPSGFRKLAKKGEGNGDEFSLMNCIWFTTASFLQQGPDYTPRGASGRILSAAFWFFVIIIVSTYTANLAAFFTTSRMQTEIKSLQDLAKQDKISYGVLDGGNTQSFFSSSKLPLYRKMFGQMETRKSFAKSTEIAISKVRNENYAYLTEHPIVSYHNQQNPCNTFLIENLLEAKSYGLGLRIDSEWTNPLSVQILKLREKGVVEDFRRKWWDDRSHCKSEASDTKTDTPSLELKSLAGVYVILCAGAAVAFAMLFVEVKYPDVFSRIFEKIGWRQKELTFEPPTVYHHEKSYLDTVDSGLVKPVPYPGERDSPGSDRSGYAFKKYLDSLKSNKHYGE